MAGHICKIALKTVPRCGIAALILLCLGFYFLFPACQPLQQIQIEKNTPFELTATTDSGSIDLSTLMQIDGVEKISPILNLGASLSLNDYTLDCEIRAVYSSFLDLRFTEGTIYPENSNMPYLILNEAAAESLSNSLAVEDTVQMTVNSVERKAVVCGIFIDNSETPVVYMNYDTAIKAYDRMENPELIFELTDVGSAGDVVSALQRKGIYADFDSTFSLSWKILQSQCGQSVFLCVALLACAAVLIRNKQQTETKERKSERLVLFLSGMTDAEAKMIFPSRLILTETICLSIAIAIAALAGKFSLLGIMMGLYFSCIHWFIIVV